MRDVSLPLEEQKATKDFEVQRSMARHGAPLNLLEDRVNLADSKDLNETEKKFLFAQLKNNRACRVVRSDGTRQSGFVSNILPSHRMMELAFWDDRKQKPQTKLVPLDEYLSWQEHWVRVSSGEHQDVSDEETVKEGRYVVTR